MDYLELLSIQMYCPLLGAQWREFYNKFVTLLVGKTFTIIVMRFGRW